MTTSIRFRGLTLRLHAEYTYFIEKGKECQEEAAADA
jgi:hypothetical protein